VLSTSKEDKYSITAATCKAERRQMCGDWVGGTKWNGQTKRATSLRGAYYNGWKRNARSLSKE
jgi:hypothetical protein